jgi:mannosyltransferase OCH1-like enzyme
MIPKIIHYCWFGGNPMPKNERAYVEGWKKLLPDYEFILWDENNFDINTVPFTQQVADAKKWGFIVDYVRAYAVYNYGGIYLDTDVELLKPLDDLLETNICFGGFENESLGKYNIAPGLIFAGEKGCIIAKDIMDFYCVYNFKKEDGTLDLTPSPVILYEILKEYGLKQDNTYQELGVFTAYPSDYFCPMSESRRITLTKNTYTVHHCAASWYTPWQKFKMKFLVGNITKNKLGRFFYGKYTKWKHGEHHN